MAKQRKKSGLAAKLGAEGRKAHESHQHDETTFDTGASLPAGIEGGIAQLTKVTFDIFKKGDFEGEYYFMAMGSIVSPEEFEGVSIKGLHTRIGPEPICDTPNRESRPDVASHLAWVYNQLAMLGVDRDDLDIDTLEEIGKALVKAAPHFRFRTWQGEPTEQYPNPRVNEVWGGACDYEEGEEVSKVEDDADTTPKLHEPEDSGEEAEAEEGLDIEALKELAEAADEGDEDAADKVGEVAESLGIDPDDIESWVKVVETIAAKSGEEEEEEEEKIVPEKGEVYLYRPPRMRKDVECEVTAVFDGKETCNLKNLDTQKSYKGVSWDSLKHE